MRLPNFEGWTDRTLDAAPPESMLEQGEQMITEFINALETGGLPPGAMVEITVAVRRRQTLLV